MNNSKIKATSIKKQDTLINARKQTNVDDKKVSFSFSDFQTHSININNFNNYYFNVESSRNAVSDFFSIISGISNLDLKELFSNATKKEYHLNKLYDEEVISRIEYVLMDGYSFPKERIDEFEHLYFEFQISDGKRVICYIVDNVICPLFIDCNHMICRESSRNIKSKSLYKVPSSFHKLGEKALSIQEKNNSEYIKEIINEYQINNDMTSDEIIDLLSEIVN